MITRVDINNIHGSSTVAHFYIYALMSIVFYMEVNSENSKLSK